MHVNMYFHVGLGWFMVVLLQLDFVSKILF